MSLPTVDCNGGENPETESNHEIITCVCELGTLNFLSPFPELYGDILNPSFDSSPAQSPDFCSRPGQTGSGVNEEGAGDSLSGLCFHLSGRVEGNLVFRPRERIPGLVGEETFLQHVQP